jgi:hypothetical protein
MYAMISRLVQELRCLKGVVFHQGTDVSLLTRFQKASGMILPPEHKELLKSSNGIEASDGYIRLFGLYTTEAIDAVQWNKHDFWKFAWDDRCSPYWCFGETAWGDQYAYAVESLREGEAPAVYFMDALSMTSEVIAPSFAEFLHKEFVRTAKDPYDAMIKLAHKKLGPLEVGTHLVYVPSVLLGGTEDIANIQRMNARSAMICNGDIAVQLDAGPPNGTVKALQPYEDAQQRMRLRLVWA